jgi:putative membrane protein
MENKESNVPSEGWDAIRRTRLAAERTELAWWRTALTSIAVAIAVGRVVPELSGTSTEWPYLVVGVGWALYSVALFGYGSIRSRRVEAAVSEGRMIESSRAESRWLMAAGVVLCLATVGLIASSA